MKQTVLNVISRRRPRSVSGECGDIAFKGYPFRIGLFCSKVTVDDSQNGVSASFGELRSAAQSIIPVISSGNSIRRLKSAPRMA